MTHFWEGYILNRMRLRMLKRYFDLYFTIKPDNDAENLRNMIVIFGNNSKT